MNAQQLQSMIEETIKKLNFDEILNTPYIKEGDANFTKEDIAIIVDLLTKGYVNNEIIRNYFKLLVKSEIMDTYKNYSWQEISAKVDAYFKQKFQI